MFDCTLQYASLSSVMSLFADVSLYIADEKADFLAFRWPSKRFAPNSIGFRYSIAGGYTSIHRAASNRLEREPF